MERKYEHSFKESRTLFFNGDVEHFNLQLLRLCPRQSSCVTNKVTVLFHKDKLVNYNFRPIVNDQELLSDLLSL